MVSGVPPPGANPEFNQNVTQYGIVVSGVPPPGANPEFNQNVTQYGILVSGVPPPGANQRTIYETPLFMLGSKHMI